MRRAAAAWPRKRSSRSPAPAASTSKTCGPDGAANGAREALSGARVAFGLDRGARRAPLGFGAHLAAAPAGSRARRGGGRGREVSERGDDRRGVRTSAGRVGVESAPHRRHMGGRIAATAADDARAAIDGKRRVSLHQLRRAGIVNLRRRAISARRRWPWRSARRPAAPRSWRGSRPEDPRRRRRSWRHRRRGPGRRPRPARRARRARRPSSCGRRCRSSR